MGTGQTKWEELGISNDFLFGKVMQNPELCRKLLQRILPGLEIDHIVYPQLQKEIRPDADAKSIRLDVYVKDDKNTVIILKCRQLIQKSCQKGAGITRACWTCR